MFKTKGIIFLLAFALLLSGCSSMFDKEYLSVEDYVAPVQEDKSDEDIIEVSGFNGLKQALLSFAYDGKAEGRILFSSGYEGDPLEDMASACWQVRTQDALCAYCVENIAYEITKIVTTNEAKVYISYSNYGESADDIVHVPYSSGVESILGEMLESGMKRLAVLVARSSYSADEISGLVTRVYRQNPAVVPREPTASVNMYSGTGAQRLYEISINYGLTAEELEQRTTALRAVDAFSGLDIDSTSEGERAIAACNYIVSSCTASELPEDNTAYAALINGQANSEGIAFAYVELCRQLKLECHIVYGQRQWSEHCWNIVKVDGNYYHVDAFACMSEGIDNGNMLLNDESFWGSYRWDVSSYPKCNGDLSYQDFSLDD